MCILESEKELKIFYIKCSNKMVGVEDSYIFTGKNKLLIFKLYLPLHLSLFSKIKPYFRNFAECEEPFSTPTIFGLTSMAA